MQFNRHSCPGDAIAQLMGKPASDLMQNLFPLLSLQGRLHFQQLFTHSSHSNPQHPNFITCFVRNRGRELTGRDSANTFLQLG